MRTLHVPLCCVSHNTSGLGITQTYRPSAPPPEPPAHTLGLSRPDITLTGRQLQGEVEKNNGYLRMKTSFGAV